MLNFKKTAQVSIFVIISAIIVLVGVFLVFNSEVDFFISHETQLKNSVSDVVKSCIEKDAENGVFLLGFQGGYIEVPKEISINPKRNVDLGVKIPNWDSERGEIPTISSMENELNNYISEKSIACIKTNIQALEESMNIEIGEENLVVKTTINKENVDIESSLPISFKEKNSEQTYYVSDYFVKLESVRLGDMYSLALEIYNSEVQDNFLEELTLDQIYSASDYSSPISMPGEGMSFTCAKRVWTIPQLKSNLIHLNNNNFKYLYIDGTSSIDSVFDANLNSEFGTLGLRDYYKSPVTGYIQQISNPSSSFRNYGAEFFVPTPVDLNRATFGSKDVFREFEVTPSSGSTVKPMDFKIDVGAKIPIPCIQIYHHLYSLDYDVMVKLTDKNDDGQNYLFQFPLRVVIKNNSPKGEAGSQVFAEPQTATNDKFCSNESRVYPYQIYAKDEFGNYLSNVNITYKCVALSCDVGTTEKPRYEFDPNLVRKNAVPLLETNFPYCIGGKVIAEANGYHQVTSTRIDTTSEILELDSTQYVDVEMKSLKSFKMDISSFYILFIEDRKGARVESEKDGFIYVSVENKALDFESEVMWPTEEGFLDTLNLINEDGTAYNLSVIYVDKDYNLKGAIEIQNWTPSVKYGNTIEFVIPATRGKVDETNYELFYSQMNDALNEYLSDFGVFIK